MASTTRVALARQIIQKSSPVPLRTTDGNRPDRVAGPAAPAAPNGSIVRAFPAGPERRKARSLTCEALPVTLGGPLMRSTLRAIGDASRYGHRRDCVGTVGKECCTAAVRRAIAGR